MLEWLNVKIFNLISPTIIHPFNYSPRHIKVTTKCNIYILQFFCLKLINFLLSIWG